MKPNGVHKLLDSLTPQEKEMLLAEQLRKLPAKSRARVINFSDSDPTVISGSNVALNIQNVLEFDPDTFFKRLAG